MARITNILSELEDFETERVSIGEILSRFKTKGFSVILFIIAIPLALPVPAPPPLNFLFGIPLLLITSQIVFGMRRPWLPKWICNKTLSRSLIENAATTVSGWLARVDKFIKPRGEFLMGSLGLWLMGICSVIMSLSIFTIYPMSNTVPSFFIALSAFGRITGDGLVMVIGLIGGLAYVSLLILLSVLLGAQIIGWFY